MTYEVVISLFMFGSGGPVSPQPFVGLADLARMAGGLLVTFGCLVILPLALLASLWIRFRSGAWSRNALRLVGLSPLLLLAWFGVPGLLERYHRQQLTLVQPRAERVAKEFVRSGELLTLHGGLRGSGYFRAAPDGSLRLTLPSHLCSHAYLKWTGQPPKDADLCIWKSGDWSYRCD